MPKTKKKQKKKKHLTFVVIKKKVYICLNKNIIAISPHSSYTRHRFKDFVPSHQVDMGNRFLRNKPQEHTRQVALF